MKNIFNKTTKSRDLPLLCGGSPQPYPQSYRNLKPYQVLIHKKRTHHHDGLPVWIVPRHINREILHKVKVLAHRKEEKKGHLDQKALRPSEPLKISDITTKYSFPGKYWEQTEHSKMVKRNKREESKKATPGS